MSTTGACMYLCVLHDGEESNVVRMWLFESPIGEFDMGRKFSALSILHCTCIWRVWEAFGLS